MLQTNRHRVHRREREHKGAIQLQAPLPNPSCREGINATLSSLPHSLPKNINLSRSSSIIASQLVYLTQKEGDKSENGHLFWLFI